MPGTWRSKAGDARKRAAARPTQPSRSLAAAASKGRLLRQSRGPIGLLRSNASSRIICVSLTRPAAGTDWYRRIGCRWGVLDLRVMGRHSVVCPEKATVFGYTFIHLLWALGRFW